MLPQIAQILDKHHAAAKTEIAALLRGMLGDGSPQPPISMPKIDVQATVLAILAKHQHGISAFDLKREILLAGVSRHTYARVMRNLQRSRKVAMSGRKREARYSVR